MDFSAVTSTNYRNLKCRKMSIIELEPVLRATIDLHSSITVRKKMVATRTNLSFDCEKYATQTTRYWKYVTQRCIHKVVYATNKFATCFDVIVFTGVCTYSTAWMKTKVATGMSKSSLPIRQRLPNATRAGILRASILWLVRAIVLVYERKHSRTIT